MLFCTLQSYGSGCGDFLKDENSQRCWLFHTGRPEPVRWSMEKCHINVSPRLAEMWRLTPGYWFMRGLTGEAMDLAFAATIKPFEMSRNQRSREMVSAHASGRNDDTLWCVARPRVQWQLDWARCPNSSPLLCCSSRQPPLTEKHDSNPLIQTPACHSEINGQIIHQWDTVLLFCPLYDKDGVFFFFFQPFRGFEETLITP